MAELLRVVALAQFSAHSLPHLLWTSSQGCNLYPNSGGLLFCCDLFFTVSPEQFRLQFHKDDFRFISLFFFRFFSGQSAWRAERQSTWRDDCSIQYLHRTGSVRCQHTFCNSVNWLKAHLDRIKVTGGGWEWDIHCAPLKVNMLFRTAF